MPCIYKIENKITNKRYIGQAYDFKYRINKYKNGGCKNQRLIYNSINSYGWENHEVVILEDNIDKNILNERETYYIDLYESWWYKFPDTGLNLLREHNTRKGVPHTQETKDKLSAVNKGKKVSKQCIEAMIAAESWRKKQRKIYQYSLEGNFIKEFESISSASREMNIDTACLSNAAKGITKISIGFQWRFEKSEKIENYVPFTKTKMFSKEKCAEIRSMIKNGIKQNKIAKDLGVSTAVISMLYLQKRNYKN